MHLVGTAVAACHRELGMLLVPIHWHIVSAPRAEAKPQQPGEQVRRGKPAWRDRHPRARLPLLLYHEELLEGNVGLTEALPILPCRRIPLPMVDKDAGVEQVLEEV